MSPKEADLKPKFQKYLKTEIFIKKSVEMMVRESLDSKHWVLMMGVEEWKEIGSKRICELSYFCILLFDHALFCCCQKAQYRLEGCVGIDILE
jgi:hypothetical protein